MRIDRTARASGARARRSRRGPPSAGRRAPPRRSSPARPGRPRRRARSTHSSTVRCRNACSSAGRRSSRCSSRPAIVAKRWSSASSGCPITPQSRSQKTCFAAPTTNQPSAASKFWNGTMVGCAEFVPPRRHEAVGRRPRPDVHQLVERGLEQRDVAVAADPVAARAPDAREQRDRGGVAAREVDERETALRRRPARLTGQGLPAREPLHHVVVAALRRARPRHPEPGERAADDPGVDVAELVVGEPELARLVAAEVRVDAVADAHEVVQHARARPRGEDRARRSSCPG